MNDRAGQGDWRIRAQFYSSTGANWGYQNGCYGYGENTVTWHPVKCYVVVPPDAATMRIQVWLVQHSGWVAVDDFTLDDLTVTGWDGVTKYYTFNGQRVALRGATGLVYLHTDHLGSTKLVTDRDGNPVQPATQYYAYGRAQAPGSVAGLPTDYTFTGQRLDNMGLVYMNARYYDPESGQFLSPDFLVPDASNVLDYNRYGYARGNPLKYNDPTGHDSCLANKSGSWDCNKNPGLGGQTQTLTIDPVRITGTTFGPDVPSYPTAYAIQLGGQAGLGLVAEAGVSGEVSVVVNFYSGEVSVFTTEGSNAQLSTPHVAYVSGYGGLTAITGASQNAVLEGPSRNGGGQIGVDIFANAGISVSSGYSVQFDDTNGNQRHDVNFFTGYTEPMNSAPALDPKFGTPVRTYSVNLSTGANIFPNGIDAGLTVGGTTSQERLRFTIPQLVLLR